MLRQLSSSLLLGLLVFDLGVNAIGQRTCVTFKASGSTFPIVSNNKATPLLLSEDDWGGVHRTAADFATDIPPLGVLSL